MLTLRLLRIRTLRWTCFPRWVLSGALIFHSVAGGRHGTTMISGLGMQLRGWIGLLVLRIVVSFGYGSHGLDRANNVCSGTVYNPTPGDDSELAPPPVVLKGQADSESAVELNHDAQYTAAELDILLEASTTLLYEW